MGGDEVAGSVINGVAGCPPHAQKLGFWLFMGADAGEVLIAISVDLTGHHHHRAATGPDYVVKEEAKGHPGAQHRFFRGFSADRNHALGPGGHTVCHEQVRFESQSSESTAHRGGRSESADQQLTVSSEGLGDGDGTNFGTRGIAHRVFTASW